MGMKQNTQEWLDFRRNKVGASDAPVIMGVSPWKTEYQLWKEKLGLENDLLSNAAMQRGNELEPEARQAFIEKSGYEVEPKVVISQKRPYAIASMDGLSRIGNVGVEIKCPGKIDHLRAVEGRVPEKYMPQLQHQMDICDLDQIFYFSYFEKKGIILTIYRDDDYIDRLIQCEDRFWKCLQDLETPPLTEKDYSQRIDHEWIQRARIWKECKDRLKECERMEEECRNKLIEVSNGSNCRGAGITITKVARRGNVDYKSIPELDSIDLEQYRKEPSQYWKVGCK